MKTLLQLLEGSDDPQYLAGITAVIESVQDHIMAIENKISHALSYEEKHEYLSQIDGLALLLK